MLYDDSKNSNLSLRKFIQKSFCPSAISLELVLALPQDEFEQACLGLHVDGKQHIVDAIAQRRLPAHIPFTTNHDMAVQFVNSGRFDDPIQTESCLLSLQPGILKFDANIANQLATMGLLELYIQVTADSPLPPCDEKDFTLLQSSNPFLQFSYNGEQICVTLTEDGQKITNKNFELARFDAQEQNNGIYISSGAIEDKPWPFCSRESVIQGIKECFDKPVYVWDSSKLLRETL